MTLVGQQPVGVPVRCWHKKVVAASISGHLGPGSSAQIFGWTRACHSNYRVILYLNLSPPKKAVKTWSISTQTTIQHKCRFIYLSHRNHNKPRHPSNSEWLRGIDVKLIPLETSNTNQTGTRHLLPEDFTKGSNRGLGWLDDDDHRLGSDGCDESGGNLI